MIIENYFDLNINKKEILLNEINNASWEASKYLYKLIISNNFNNEFGNGVLLILHEDYKLIGHVVVVEKDCVESSLKPWLGFLFIKEEYRQRDYSKLLIEEACNYAKKMKYSRLYLATDKIKFYEKFGFIYLFDKADKFNKNERIYYRALTNQKNNSYKSIELTGEDIDILKDRGNKKEYKNICDTHWDGA